MRFLSLFAGVGGFDLGLERSGHECVGQVEIDPFCRRVLERRWPGVARWADVATILPSPAIGTPRDDSGGGIDLLTGGFPCQDLSVAGKRAGLAGERSGLFYEIVRIAQAIRPAWGLFENVPGLFSSHGGRDMASVLEGLRHCWPVVGYRVLDSQHFGVPQRRRRVFFVCGPDEARVASVLFEPESGGGHRAAGGEAGKDIAASVTPGVGRVGSRGADDGANIVTAQGITRRYAKGCDSDATDTLVIAATLNSGGNSGGFRTEPGEDLVMQCHGNNVGPMGALRKGDGGLTSGVPFIAHTLKADGHDASEDGTGRGTPMIWALQEVGARESKNQNGVGIGLSGDDTMYTLQAGQTHGVGTPAFVRRLTPVECERLQGFPDGWTCLCLPLTAYADDPEEAALRCRCPDSPRYRAMGNAVTVNVVEWIGHRLARAVRQAVER